MIDVERRGKPAGPPALQAAGAPTEGTLALSLLEIVDILGLKSQKSAIPPIS